MKVFVATHNAHKIHEISKILPNFEIIADDPEGIEENAPDFIGNALIKVRAIASRHPGAWCLADDSGLVVDALDGTPGVRSARYAGEPSNTAANNALLLKNLDGVTNRQAHFVCALALVAPDGTEHTVEGRCSGRIAEKPSGATGFGYDPLFIPEGHAETFAELSENGKNAISHRGRALAQAVKIIAPRKENRLMTWLRFFRIVNLPTVPGDVLVGALATLLFCNHAVVQASMLVFACMASCCLYLYGLADNDIVGARVDKDRPIPEGLISLPAARFARGLCWGGLLIAGALARTSVAWWIVALALFATILIYNRTKTAFLMGLCRGLNVLSGAAAVGLFSLPLQLPEGECPACVDHWTLPLALTMGGLVLLWTVLIGLLTKLSEGEETDPAKKQLIGQLIGSLIYLQIAVAAIMACMKLDLAFRQGALITLAVCILARRLMSRFLRGVSGS